MAEPILLGTTEEWKTIPFAPNYEASTLGQVRSWMVWGGGGYGRPLRHPRLLRPSLKKKGKGYYGLILVTPEGRKDFRVNRLVALTFIPNPENKSDVNHKDLNKLNDRVDNLEWMWPIENTRHAIENGAVNNKGEANYSAVLSDVKVKAILREWGCSCFIARPFKRKEGSCPHGATMPELAARFGVSKATIQRVTSGSHWAHVHTTI